MGKKEEKVNPLNLEITVPTFFQCPISLDLMRSPVSLCTGVTYDRTSIQRWLDSGKNTCPATNQPLPSTDLIPNLTLRRLADSFLDAQKDHLEKNALLASSAAAASSLLIQNAARIETLEAAAKVFAVILSADFIEEKNKTIALSPLISDLNPSVSALLSILKSGETAASRADAARLLGAILLMSSDSDSKALIAEKSDLIPELIRLIRRETDLASIDAGTECLMAIYGVRRARFRMVKEGIVPAAVKVLKADAAAAAERAMRLLEAAAGIAEGRSEICEAAAECLGAVLGRMMKVGREGMEAAVAVLWSVCHRFRDRRAVEAVAAEDGGAAKILLLMQSDCSPAVRQMAGDLLRIFRVNTKSCLVGYDTETTHIMPF